MRAMMEEAESQAARLRKAAEVEARRLRENATHESEQQRLAAEKARALSDKARAQLAEGHNNVARSVLSEELRILDEDAQEAREEAAEAAQRKIDAEIAAHKEEVRALHRKEVEDGERLKEVEKSAMRGIQQAFENAEKRIQRKQCGSSIASKGTPSIASTAAGQATQSHPLTHIPPLSPVRCHSPTHRCGGGREAYG